MVIYLVRKSGADIPRVTTDRLSRRVEALEADHGGLEILAVVDGRSVADRDAPPPPTSRVVGGWVEPSDGVLGIMMGDGGPDGAVRLDLSAECRRLLRVIAAMDGRSPDVVASRAVERFVRAEAKRRGIRR